MIVGMLYCVCYMRLTKCAFLEVDLVVHAAGPFQQAEKCTVLEAAIETKVRKGNPFCCLSLWFSLMESVWKYEAYDTNDGVSLSLQTSYIDVCDDMKYSRRAKSLKDKALAANIPAITTAGIYPGVSNGLCRLSLLLYSLKCL